MLNFIKNSANLIGININVVDEGDVDVEILSCFSIKSSVNKAGMRLLYLGENVRPNYWYCDYSLSFDYNDYLERNIYCPLWLLRSKSFAMRSPTYDIIELDSCDKEISIRGAKKVVYVGNNMTPIRQELIYTLRKYEIEVDCYGSQTKSIENKNKLLREYMYCISFDYYIYIVFIKVI